MEAPPGAAGREREQYLMQLCVWLFAKGSLLKAIALYRSSGFHRKSHTLTDSTSCEHIHSQQTSLYSQPFTTTGWE